MSKFITGTNRNQLPLFASSIDDAITQDNQVRLFGGPNVNKTSIILRPIKPLNKPPQMLDSSLLPTTFKEYST